MKTPRNRLAGIVQLALSAAWLMAGAVYLFTPARMASVLAMSDAARVALGIAMVLSAAIAAIGTISRGRTTSIVGVGLLAFAGIAWVAYDLLRHWLAFAAYDASLAVTAIALLIFRAREP
jgi:hypothetical protein